jgi:hypothetical protein
MWLKILKYNSVWQQFLTSTEKVIKYYVEFAPTESSNANIIQK